MGYSFDPFKSNIPPPQKKSHVSAILVHQLQYYNTTINNILEKLKNNTELSMLFRNTIRTYTHFNTIHILRIKFEKHVVNNQFSFFIFSKNYFGYQNGEQKV